MLTATQTSFFEENGYLVLENLFDEERVLAPVRAALAVQTHIPFHRWASNAPFCA